MALAPSGKCRPTLAGTQHVPGLAGEAGVGPAPLTQCV